jgi:hypothetical protein
MPRADGLFLTDNPQRLIQQSKVANVPFITGSVDDEGTIFSLSTLNITYVGSVCLHPQPFTPRGLQHGRRIPHVDRNLLPAQHDHRTGRRLYRTVLKRQRGGLAVQHEQLGQAIAAVQAHCGVPGQFLFVSVSELD